MTTSEPTYPRIIGRKQTVVSRWVSLVEKTVQFGGKEEPQTFHCLTQADYVAIMAITEDGLIPIVRQFRPCVEDFTWEFPGGTVDKGETPEQAARRELLEEAGLHAEEMVYLGNFLPDTGRLQVASHAFFARASRTSQGFQAEAGLEVKSITHPQLCEMMRAMEFRHQLHLALYASVLVRGLVKAEVSRGGTKTRRTGEGRV